MVGRAAELASIFDWYEASTPATLVIDGPAGLGKTTIWAAGVAGIRERGAYTITSSPTEAESRLSYSGLADLIADELPGIQPALSRPQARALAIAMRLEEPGDRPADETAVARGFLAALQELGRSRGQVLVAVDDFRWLDGPTLNALIYAARRLRPEDRVHILTTHRAGSSHPAGLLEGETATRLSLESLSVGSIHRIIRLRTGVSLARPRLLEVHEAARGNPLHALELARAVAAGGRIETGSLAALFASRIADLPAAAREALVLLAASADRSLHRLDLAARSDFAANAAAALDAGLAIVVGGQAFPAHPLVTVLAYEGASEPTRRSAHAALADTATNDEERALHLGRSLDGTDVDAARVIEGAARGALSRGVRALAASLFESSARVTPAEALVDRGRRLLAASAAWFDSGDTGRVEAILGPLIDELPPGVQRCEARWRLGKALDEAGRWRDATRLWQEALDESDDLALRSQVMCSMAITALYTDTLERAAALAASGVGEAERSGDQRSLGRALAVAAFVGAVRGDLGYRAVMDRALAIEAALEEPLGEWSPSVLAAECARHTGDVTSALRFYHAVLDRAAAAGDANVEQWAAFGLAWTEIVAGNFRSAAEHADLVLDIADQTGVMGIPARTLRAHVDAWLGDLPAARALVGDAIARATSADEATHRFGGLTVLGVIEGLAGDPGAGARALREARGLAGQLGLAHASALRAFIAEAELAAAAGDLDQADQALASFDGAARSHSAAWTAPLRRRASAAILAGRGDLAAAAAELEAAAVDDAALAPDRARALLALGSVLRRLRELRRSRVALEQALALFQELGTPPWVEAAEAELARLPGRRPEASQRLTNAEAAIARLVAAGRTNREVAAELVLSVKTIEVTLTRVYEKLGVRSRAELAAQFREAASA
jgi:DNA-binding CsgD family transcriptional regulator